MATCSDAIIQFFECVRLEISIWFKHGNICVRTLYFVFHAVDGHPNLRVYYNPVRQGPELDNSAAHQLHLATAAPYIVGSMR